MMKETIIQEYYIFFSKIVQLIAINSLNPQIVLALEIDSQFFL